MLAFPSDVTEALVSGDTNPQKSAQLTRLTPHWLARAPPQERTTRKEVLQARLKMRGSQNALRARQRKRYLAKRSRSRSSR